MWLLSWTGQLQPMLGCRMKMLKLIHGLPSGISDFRGKGSQINSTTTLLKQVRSPYFCWSKQVMWSHFKVHRSRKCNPAIDQSQGYEKQNVLSLPLPSSCPPSLSFLPSSLTFLPLPLPCLPLSFLSPSSLFSASSSNALNWNVQSILLEVEIKFQVIWGFFIPHLSHCCLLLISVADSIMPSSFGAFVGPPSTHARCTWHSRFRALQGPPCGGPLSHLSVWPTAITISLSPAFLDST